MSKDVRPPTLDEIRARFARMRPAVVDPSTLWAGDGPVVVFKKTYDDYAALLAVVEEREQLMAILRRWHFAYCAEKYTDAEADAAAEAAAWLERHGELEPKS